MSGQADEGLRSLSSKLDSGSYHAEVCGHGAFPLTFACRDDKPFPLLRALDVTHPSPVTCLLCTTGLAWVVGLMPDRKIRILTVGAFDIIGRQGVVLLVWEKGVG